MNNLDSLIGQTIDDRYLITARIARGGMASVYRATDQRLGREVALKIIHPHLAEQENFTQRFIQEARSAAALSNPHIVNVHDQGITPTADGDRAYLVMELVTGPNLRNALRENGSFSLGITLEITRQILTALAAAHAKGYIHRDVKPENILLAAPVSNSDLSYRQNVNAKVADFGLARAAASSTGIQTSTVLGTITYIAPEIFTREKISPAADIYAVGILLYELLTGKLPYVGESPFAIAAAHVNEPMPRLSDDYAWIPPAIDSLIAVFTAKNPQKRPQNASAALDVFDDICAYLPAEILLRRIPVFPSTNQLSQATKQLHPSKITSTASAASEDTIDDTDAKHTATAPLTNTQSTFDTAQLPPTATELAPESAPQKNAVQKKRKNSFALAFFLIFVSIAGSAFGYWYFTFGPGLRVTIPAIATLSEAQAAEKLTAAGFKFEVQRAFSDDIAKDQAIDTNPSAGTKVHPEQVLMLIISDGIEHKEVPDVTGKNSAAAIEALQAQTFHVEASEDWSEDVPQGNVITQEPAAAASIPHDSVVKIVVSKGRQPITVPQLTGITRDNAEKLLAELGLKPEISEEFSADIPKGTIISQDIAQGETRYKNDPIKLVVSKGPPLVKVPNVVGQQEAAAKKVLEEAGFKVEIKRILGGFFGTVRLQSPAAEEMVEPGSTITLSVV